MPLPDSGIRVICLDCKICGRNQIASASLHVSFLLKQTIKSNKNLWLAESARVRFNRLRYVSATDGLPPISAERLTTGSLPLSFEHEPERCRPTASGQSRNLALAAFFGAYLLGWLPW